MTAESKTPTSWSFKAIAASRVFCLLPIGFAVGRAPWAMQQWPASSLVFYFGTIVASLIAAVYLMVRWPAYSRMILEEASANNDSRPEMGNVGEDATEAKFLACAATAFMASTWSSGLGVLLAFLGLAKALRAMRDGQFHDSIIAAAICGVLIALFAAGFIRGLSMAKS